MNTVQDKSPVSEDRGSRQAELRLINPDAVRTMLRDGELGKLKGKLTRYQIRTQVLPLIREHLDIDAEVHVPGLRTNWAGRDLMSRFAI